MIIKINNGHEYQKKKSKQTAPSEAERQSTGQSRRERQHTSASGSNEVARVLSVRAYALYTHLVV
jgi:hypothetical protein